jgi:hypothetical protein
MQGEIYSLLAYSTFHDEGHIKCLPGYQNIHVHFVFAVKHDLCHKARLVAGGHDMVRTVLYLVYVRALVYARCTWYSMFCPS